jgi:hypothetical protein
MKEDEYLIGKVGFKIGKYFNGMRRLQNSNLEGKSGVPDTKDGMRDTKRVSSRDRDSSGDGSGNNGLDLHRD